MSRRSPPKTPINWRFLAACATTGMLAFGAQGARAGVTLQATGNQSATWSSNPLLLTSGAKSLAGSTTSPELFFRDATPTSLVGLDARVDENVFDQSGYNSTDMHAATDLSETNARWLLGLKQNTDYDTTRTSEVAGYGTRAVSTRHLGLTENPQITYRATATDSFSLGGAVTSSRYGSHLYTDYETFSATPSYTHQIDPLNAAILSFQAQQYQTTYGPSLQVDSLGPSVGWQGKVTPRFTANAAIGAETTRQYDTGAPTGPWTWQYTYVAGLDFKGTQDTISFNTARAQFPYGNGTEALQTSFNLSESRKITPLFSLDLGGVYQISTYQVSTPGNVRSYAEGNVGFTYHATERIDIKASYSYRYETLIDTASAARDNAVMIGIGYHPKLWTLLR
jgi:hypothetical protein